MSIDDEATTCGIGDRRQFNAGAVLGLHAYRKIVGQGRREHQWGAFDWEYSDAFWRQKTWFGSTVRSGGNCAASTAGSAATNTDLGLRKEGGLLSFRFN